VAQCPGGRVLGGFGSGGRALSALTFLDLPTTPFCDLVHPCVTLAHLCERPHRASTASCSASCMTDFVADCPYLALLVGLCSPGGNVCTIVHLPCAAIVLPPATGPPVAGTFVLSFQSVYSGCATSIGIPAWLRGGYCCPLSAQLLLAYLLGLREGNDGSLLLLRLEEGVIAHSWEGECLASRRDSCLLGFKEGFLCAWLWGELLVCLLCNFLWNPRVHQSCAGVPLGFEEGVVAHISCALHSAAVCVIRE
jgi:hypothetical protein